MALNWKKYYCCKTLGIVELGISNCVSLHVGNHNQDN